MVIMNDLEWPMFSYYVIYYEKLKKVMQWTEKEALGWAYYDHIICYFWWNGEQQCLVCIEAFWSAFRSYRIELQ